jgi:hypothetical protein
MGEKGGSRVKINVNIKYSDGSETNSNISKEGYEILSKWYLNPKACKTFTIKGANNNNLHINKGNIIYMLTKGIKS